jgi:cyclic 2,3-diphosphoglycerate synthetase
MRVLALIDGEHHPAVTRDALDRVADKHELSEVLFIGGEEKLGEEVWIDPVSSWGRRVTRPAADPALALRELAAHHDLDRVVDLSGDPVLDEAARFRLACLALSLGLEYHAPGLRLSAPPRQRLSLDAPVIEVIGTAKRTGKTALAGHYARLLRDQGIEPVVVAMGRGGPAEPQLVRAEERPDLGTLRAIARAGGHAASDYLEDAVLAGITCVGCRRCGEGPAGETFASNVLDGAMLAVSLDPEVLLIEGSGAALPPIAADHRVCVTNASGAPDALSYLGPLRLMGSDLIVIVGADRLPAHELREAKRALSEWSGTATLIGCGLEPEPVEPVPAGGRVAFFCTAAPEHEAELKTALERQGVDVRLSSTNLARRAELRRDLDRAKRERCDVYLTELKAAAIELVAEDAERNDAALVLVRNRPVSAAGEPDLDAALTGLVEEARSARPAGAITRARQA